MSNHKHSTISKTKSPTHYLLLTFFLTLLIFVAEVVGGLITGSLALLSDAAHMLTDLTALTISIIAIKIGQRPADKIRTFGYQRFEIIAAALNATLLFFVAIYIVYEAYQRLYQPARIYSVGMLSIATIGLISNLIAMRLMSPGKQGNLNIKSAYLEIWSDMIASIGVIIGALLIMVTGWSWIDSIIAVLIGFWVLPRTWLLLKESINILLEGVPREIDLKTLLDTAIKVEGIVDIHDLHVWAITSNKISLTAHVVIHPQFDYEDVLGNLRQLLIARFGIGHMTLQPERKKCPEIPNDFH